MSALYRSSTLLSPAGPATTGGRKRRIPPFALPAAFGRTGAAAEAPRSGQPQRNTLAILAGRLIKNRSEHVRGARARPLHPLGRCRSMVRPRRLARGGSADAHLGVSHCCAVFAESRSSSGGAVLGAVGGGATRQDLRVGTRNFLQVGEILSCSWQEKQKHYQDRAASKDKAAR